MTVPDLGISWSHTYTSDDIVAVPGYTFSFGIFTAGVYVQVGLTDQGSSINMKVSTFSMNSLQAQVLLIRFVPWTTRFREVSNFDEERAKYARARKIHNPSSVECFPSFASACNWSFFFFGSSQIGDCSQIADKNFFATLRKQFLPFQFNTYEITKIYPFL